MAVLFTIVVIQATPGFLLDLHREEVMYRTAFSTLGLPVLMLPLALAFRWTVRRRFTSAQTLLTSLAVASVMGALFSVTCWSAVKDNARVLARLPYPVTYPVVILGGVLFGIVLCGEWALAFVYPFLAEDARLRALEAEKLKIEAEKLRSSAELARLRTQLEPHFLLNTLNAIAGLVADEPREARRLIGCLGDLLRDVLRDADELQTLGAEIAWLRRYAEILESRHAGSLTFQWEIAADAERALVPRLLFQPLVENAVKHGALRRGAGGEVRVRATIVDGARVLCTVEDNGPGMGASPPRAGAFGLHAVRRRVELKCAGGHLQVESSPEGTRCVVNLPLVVERRAEPEVTT
jgi:sensor histidine kinase YesM